MISFPASSIPVRVGGRAAPQEHRAARAGVPDGAGWRPGPAATVPLMDKPAVAVLPFDNMSGDPEQAYFSDGITEDISRSSPASANSW